jgi:hypothetical protein
MPARLMSGHGGPAVVELTIADSVASMARIFKIVESPSVGARVEVPVFKTDG